MWFEISLVPFILLLVLFFIFFVVQEGSKWQKHKYLGVFARFIQASPRRTFLIFFTIMVLSVPSTMMLLHGYWVDALAGAGMPDSQTPGVYTLLVMILVLAAIIPVMWSSFRTWRQTVRSAAEVRVRTTAE
ncbi:hypothetical protein EU546_02795 [Candidatus Thorarchaeota archaeon]|nr:MAG: hypothetical protein EU546_02795 [Candidatus Thorarchaeota archaeon]